MRDDEERDDDEPEDRSLRKTKSGIPLWAWFTLGLTAVFVVCGGGLGMLVLLKKTGEKMAQQAAVEADASSGRERVCKLGEPVQTKDLTVTIVEVQGGGFLEAPEFGRAQPQSGLVLFVSFSNKNPNRNIKVGSQVGRATCKDDVGNEYQTLRIRGNVSNAAQGLLFFHIPERTAIELRSDSPAGDLVIFKEPVPGATKLSITLDLGVYGGEGTLLINLSRDDWVFKPRP